MKQLRVGVIGAGRWSAAAHLPGFHRSPYAELVVLCDLHRELAEARAAEFGIPEVTSDAAEVLRRDERVSEAGASLLARAISAVIFISITATIYVDLSDDEVIGVIRDQVRVLLPR